MSSMQHHTWLDQKPEFTQNCICISAIKLKDQWFYNSYMIWDYGQGYMAWCDIDGEEYGYLEDFSADKYFTTPIL